MISLLSFEAVIITPSAPTPFVNDSTNLTWLIPSDGLMAVMPFSLAILIFLESKSKPITLHPLACNNSAVIKPIKPSPTTTIVSPKVGFNNLIPCRPIAPITVKVDSSSETLSGIFATKFFGIQTYSAWCPFETTLSPTQKSLTPFQLILFFQHCNNPVELVC